MGRTFGAIASASLVEARGGNGLMSLISTVSNNLISAQINEPPGQANAVTPPLSAEALAKLPNESQAETIRLNRPVVGTLTQPITQPTTEPPVATSHWAPVDYGYVLNRAGYYDLDNATSTTKIFSGLAGISGNTSTNGTNGTNTLGDGFSVENTYGTVYARSANLRNASGTTVMTFAEDQWSTPMR
jgi:hypothetical protein